MIGYFIDKETDSYKTFRRVAMQLRDNCEFHAAVGLGSFFIQCDFSSLLHTMAKQKKQQKNF